MEFGEKLQELRKMKGLTQEELAEGLYVSRTAVSKWESGRGYPSIDSLKDISNYFSVSIDDLLSGDKLILLAEKETKSNIKNICDLFFGILDLGALMLIILPLYPRAVEGYIFSVNLWNYTETANYNRIVYWCLFSLLILCGLCKILLTKLKIDKGRNMITWVSFCIGILTVFYLVLAREAYAAMVAFLLVIIKGFIVKYPKM